MLDVRPLHLYYHPPNWNSTLNQSNLLCGFYIEIQYGAGNHPSTIERYNLADNLGNGSVNRSCVGEGRGTFKRQLLMRIRHFASNVIMLTLLKNSDILTSYIRNPSRGVTIKSDFGTRSKEIGRCTNSTVPDLFRKLPARPDK